jgi:LacI family transcriptional regulator, galactose operon repressor
MEPVQGQAPLAAGRDGRRVGRPTMRDVALAAEVDASTVSRALNPATRHKVSPDTVSRVQAAAQRLGYRMNTLARGLRLNQTMAVGMVLPDIANPFFPPVVRGAEDEFARVGRTLIVVNTDDDIGRETAAIGQLVERQVDALILATSHLASRAPVTSSRAVPGSRARMPVGGRMSWRRSDTCSLARPSP